MTTQNTTDNTSNTVTSVYEALVGNGKKFADNEALARSKTEGDAFIERLKEEKRQLEQEALRLQRENTTLKAASSIRSQLNHQDDDDTTVTSTTTNTSVTPDVKALSAEDVEKLYDKRDKQKARNANLTEVDATLTKVLGTEAVSFVQKKALELGIEAKALMDIGLDNPKLLYATLGINPNAQAGSNTMYVPSGLKPQSQTTVRNKAWYDTKQKEMGTVKFVMDRNLQVQLHKDMQSLGDAWDAA